MASGRPPGVGAALVTAIHWVGRLGGRLFPPACVLCGACGEPDRAPVCRVCWSRLPRAVPPRCGRCGAPGPRFVDGVRACPECLRWPRGLQRARSPFLMEAGSAELVHALKYRGWTALAERMGRAMAPAARAVVEADGRGERRPPDLVAVPLTEARRRQRGYNQAALLADALAAELAWPRSSPLRATAGGGRQARLGARSRRDNALGRYRARAPGDRGRAALVVDDVLTTASTAGACVAALERRGWRPLGAVTFARAVAGPRGSGRTDADGRARRPRRQWHGSRRA